MPRLAPATGTRVDSAAKHSLACHVAGLCRVVDVVGDGVVEDEIPGRAAMLDVVSELNSSRVWPWLAVTAV
jgi:hypothetical protein